MSLLGFAHRRHLPPKSIHEPALQSPVLVAVAASCPLASLPELLYLNLTDLRFAASYLYVLRVLQSSLIPASTALLPHVLLSGHQMDQGVNWFTGAVCCTRDILSSSAESPLAAVESKSIYN